MTLTRTNTILGLTIAALWGAGILANQTAIAGEKGHCSYLPTKAPKPLASIEAQLQEQGYTIQNSKMDDGCYKIRADNGAGSVKLTYHPETAELLQAQLAKAPRTEAQPPQ